MTILQRVGWFLARAAVVLVWLVCSTNYYPVDVLHWDDTRRWLMYISVAAAPFVFLHPDTLRNYWKVMITTGVLLLVVSAVYEGMITTTRRVILEERNMYYQLRGNE